MCAPYSDQSVYPSVHPSLLVQRISSLPLAQSGSYFTHRVPFSVTDIDRRKDRQTQQLNSIPLSSFSKIGFFKVNKKNFLMGTPKTKANASYVCL